MPANLTLDDFKRTVQKSSPYKDPTVRYSLSTSSGLRVTATRKTEWSEGMYGESVSYDTVNVRAYRPGEKKPFFQDYTIQKVYDRERDKQYSAKELDDYFNEKLSNFVQEINKRKR